MKLYIGNATKQTHHFVYRLVEQQGISTQDIPPGAQIMVSPGDMSQEEIDYIVNQHARYGLRKADEIDRTRTFVGLCYSIDKPITLPKLLAVLNHNTDILVARGQKTREEAAVAVSNAIERELEPAQSETSIQLARLVTTVEEIEPKAGFSENAKPVSAGVIVERNAGRGPVPGQQEQARTRSRRARAG